MNATKVELPIGANPKIIIASIRERNLFIEFFHKQQDFEITHISKVEGKEKWDIIFISAGTQYLAEIKVRDNFINSFDEEGWILEKPKYDFLINSCKTQKAIKNKLKPLYINIFKDGVVIWKIDEFTPEFKQKECNIMSVENKGKKTKNVALLHSSQGTVYKSNYDISLANFLAINMFKFLFPGVKF